MEEQLIGDSIRPGSTRLLWLALLLGLLGSAGCQTEGDYFFLERDGAVMPIWVRGNVDSRTLLLMVHGGPGDSAQWYIESQAFKALEARYGVAYWDQRGSGTSQGAPPASTFTVDEYVGDVDAVVKLLRARHPIDRLFVIGHSWGGFLATAWLLDPAHQVGVHGYVMMDGGFDLAHGFELARQYIAQYAQAQVDAGVDVENWKAALAWATQNPPPPVDKDSLTRLSLYVAAVRGYQWNATGSEITFERLFLSPLDIFAYLKNQTEALSHYDLAGLDLTAQMSAILVPTLITWGRHDGILPVALAQQAYDALGTAPQGKSVVVFEDSAHSPYAEEPDRWLEAVTTFIDAR